MFNSLKKWVQDKAVDFTPPTPPSQPSPSSSTFLSSSKSGSISSNYFYSTGPSYEQQYHEHLSTSPFTSSRSLSRPISMDSMGSHKMFSATSAIPPALASPVELDLSHLNREEQEHIANVLRRARAADEQQQQQPVVSSVVVPFKQPPAAPIVLASLSPSASSSSSSSSTSTNSFNGESPEKYYQYDKNDNHDDNEIRANEELATAPSTESTVITIHRCQVCNKEQQYPENTTICLQCQEDEEIGRITQNNTSSPFTPIEKTLSASSSSPRIMASNEHEDDQIYDNVIRIDQDLINANSPIEEDASYLLDHYAETMNDHQGREEKQLRQSPPISSLVKTRSNNLTEIDEDDFFYQGPSPYATTNSLPEKLEEPPIPSYKIDEYVDEDYTDERDHVKELEETIANISRHFPVSSDQLNDTELNSIETNFRQPSNLSVGKIDIDSILEMEIESPSIDEHRSIHLPLVSSQPPLNIPISVPISVNNNRRGSLSRSSGVRENLTDLLVTTTIEPYPTDELPLHRTSSIHSKRVIPSHRQKRNLPSVPTMTNQLRLRRANSESRFSLPAVPVPIIVSNGNFDDESDLLEIDLNDPTGSLKRTARSKTESEIPNSNDSDYHFKSIHTTNLSPSVDELSSTRKQTVKQLRDQTTNTPPISSLNCVMKPKKKLKKKASSSSINTNGQLTPTRTNPPAVIVPSPSMTNTNRSKLQKSTSTEMSYPFPVSKLILSRDNLSPSRRTGADLGLRISGGHSLPNCMEVTACIEHIDARHRNYNILKNAVQEGDEVLEVGGVSLRGKSALFVENLMKSIEDEFEIVVRSQNTLQPTSPPIEIHRPDKSNQSEHNLTVSSLLNDPNVLRRHSMDTGPNHSNNDNDNTVVKSHSAIMPLPLNNTSNVTEQLLSPTVNRRKSVSSKERLFSVESLNRTSSIKSNEHLIKVAKSNLPETYSPKPTTILSVTTPDNKTFNEDLINSSQPVQRRRVYEHRNSLLPNDPGLNGGGSNQSIDRRSSNESDESDNLSQYFRSPSSRKSSLLATNDVTSSPNPAPSQERSHSVTPIDTTVVNDASRRLQDFLKSNDEKRSSSSSVGHESDTFSKSLERKSSGLGSFKFLKKKTKSVEFFNQSVELRENEYVGDIEIQIGHNSDREQLVIRIIKAKNLPAKDANGYSDPFVKVYLLPGRDQENKRRTKHISKNLNPCWEHTAIYGNMHREELQYKMLEFTVWDYDRFKANDFIGQITINLKDAHVIDDKPHWYRLQALRSREEATNRGSSPRLFQTQVDSTAASTSTLNKTTVNTQSRTNQRK